MLAARGARTGVGVVAAAIVAAMSGGVVVADHSWGDYHWARTASPFTLTVVNSTTSDWDDYVAAALADWSRSAVVNFSEDTSGATTTQVRRQCKGPLGQVRICNLAYGYNGWLGVAGISIDTAGHIVSGYTKLNDSYFNTSYYNHPDWKQSVTCQELGHNLGLDHQDENFNNQSLFSCMDYQDPPYAWANDHDLEQLEIIYGHLDSYDSYVTSGGGGGGDEGGTCNAPPGKGCNKADGTPGNPDPGNPDPGWGMSLGRRGQAERFIRIDPDGMRHVTFVRWVNGR